MIKCFCVDDSDKPLQIPNEKWVEKGKQYTLAFTMTVSPQKKLAFQLQEIDLDDSCSPYTWFLASRFAFDEKDIPALIEFIQECNKITFSVKELMKVTKIDERESNTVEKN
jgi:hypothetical protein